MTVPGVVVEAVGLQAVVTGSTGSGKSWWVERLAQEYLGRGLRSGVVVVDRSDCTDLEAARRWWVRVRQGLGHGARETIGWFRTNGESRAGRVLRSLDQFSRVAARLARVDLECRPAVEVITLWDAPDVLHYCDPPYLSSTRRSPGDRYAVEMTTADHERLAETLHAVQGAVLLSGYPDPLYEVLYAGWHRTEIPNRLLAGQVASGENSRPVTEVIWQNRPPPQRGLYDALPSPP